MEKSLSIYIIIKKIIKYLSMPLSVSNQVKLKRFEGSAFQKRSALRKTSPSCALVLKKYRPVGFTREFCHNNHS